MLLRFQILVVILLVCSGKIHSQLYESIESAASEYFIQLSIKDSNADDYLLRLKNLLDRNYDKSEFENIYQISPNDYDSLKNHFNTYELTIRNISRDSALVLFNQWYLHFSNTFYNYADEKFFSSEKDKILFFSASMSCHCTMEMCRKQTIEIMKLTKEKALKYWIVDSYEHNELQIKYETLFAPSLIMFDENNNVMLKIEYDENMIAKVSQFVK